MNVTQTSVHGNNVAIGEALTEREVADMIMAWLMTMDGKSTVGDIDLSQIKDIAEAIAERSMR